MCEGLRVCYRLAPVPDFDSVKLPLPVGEGWGEGGLPILTDKHHIPDREFNTAKVNPPDAF